MTVFLRFLLLSLIISFLPIIGNSQDPNTPVPYTLADRDRLTRVEIELSSFRVEVDREIKGLRNEINIRFESQQKQFEYFQKQIDDFKSIFFWITGVIISLILMLFGYIVWDRHTVLRPFHQEHKNTVTSLEKLKSVLIDFGRENPKIKEALERHGF